VGYFPRLIFGRTSRIRARGVDTEEFPALEVMMARGCAMRSQSFQIGAEGKKHDSRSDLAGIE
jgi:hypothetical protein